MIGDRTSPAFFEAKYQADVDPWSFATDPDELARYEQILELVGPGPVGPTFEPACSVGVLTARLAERCRPLWAIDVAPSAVAEARRRCEAFPHVTVAVGALPGDRPPGPFDLVVFSEVGYYFERDELADVVADMAGSLRPRGRLIACHWLGESPDHVLHGSVVQQVIEDVLDATAAVRPDRSIVTERFVAARWILP